jgi:hypothetical protein
MRINIDVTYTDGSGADVSVSAPDFVAFEREFDRSVAKFASEIRFTDICWLAWYRLGKQGDARPFDTWIESVENVEIGGSDDIVPLETTAQPSS